jgi:hypothetical protein
MTCPAAISRRGGSPGGATGRRVAPGFGGAAPRLVRPGAAVEVEVEEAAKVRTESK